MVRVERGRDELCARPLLISMEVVQNSPGTWCSLEVLRRVFANLHNALDDTRMDLWRGGCDGHESAKAAPADHPEEPRASCSRHFLTQRKRAAYRLSQILLGPWEACSRATLRRVARSAIQSTSIVSFTSLFPLSMTPVKLLKQPLPFSTSRASSLAC